MHPSEALFQGMQAPQLLPACDHYAGSEKLMRKSLALQQQMGPVFDITFDCEDGAATGNEAAHAQLVSDLIVSEENHFDRIGVRVHDAASPYFEQDVATICKSAAKKLAYVVIPKVESALQLKDAIDLLMHYAHAAGRTDLPVHALIETHRALHEVWTIAAMPDIACLSFGIMDFVSAHYGAIPATAMRSPKQFTHPLVVRAKLDISAACHAHGKIASHNVTTEIKDLTVVANDALYAKQELGFNRMWSIHPDQIRPILDAYSPAADEVNDALQILLAAQAQNWGPIQHKDKLHDRASYRYYWTLLQQARLSGLALPDSASSLV